VSEVLRTIDCTDFDYNVSADAYLGKPMFKCLLFQVDFCPNLLQLSGGTFQAQEFADFRAAAKVLPCSSIQKILVLWPSQRYFNYGLSFNVQNHQDCRNVPKQLFLYSFIHRVLGLFLISHKRDDRAKTIFLRQMRWFSDYEE